MKVLKNNYNITESVVTTIQSNPYPRKFVCENCNSELEYEKSDLRVGAFGCVYLDCPLCKYDNLIDGHEDSVTLTMNNIEFPTHFLHISKDEGSAEHCTNENIKKYICQAINYFRENKEDYDWGSWITGDCYVHVHRYSGDEDYDVTISKDFYNTIIPFEKEDY